MNTEHQFRINHTVKFISILYNMYETALGNYTTCLTVQEWENHFNLFLAENLSKTYYGKQKSWQKDVRHILISKRWSCGNLNKDHLWHYCFKSKEKVTRCRSSAGKVSFLVIKKVSKYIPLLFRGENRSFSKWVL